MLRTYLRIAARILARNKIYTIINVLGLALGVCTCIIIWLVDSSELSFDSFHPDGDRIYRVVLGPGEPKVPMILPPMPEAMRATVSGLESMTAYFPFNASETVQVPLQGHTTQEFKPKLPGEEQATSVILADTGWFHVFSYKWLAGDPVTALKVPYQVVLTASAAKRYFGDIPPAAAIGRELIYADSLHVHVSGVVRDWTQHSEVAYTDIISLLTVDASFLKQSYHLQDWVPHLDPTNPWPYTYVKLGKGVKTAQVVTQMNRIAAQRQLRTPGGAYLQTLQPLSEIHFDASYAVERRHRAHLPTLYALAGVALFILILAAVNYVNLATAQSLQRAKEIGVRKVLGSGMNSLVRQFLFETGVLTVLALLIAVVMVWPVARDCGGHSGEQSADRHGRDSRTGHL